MDRQDAITRGNRHDPRHNPGNGLLFAAAAGIGLCLAARSLVRQSRWMDLYGRSVFITGGSRGLGLLLAREFLDQGARVAVCARDADELDRAAVDLGRRGGSAVTTHVCDITDRAQVEQTVRDVEQRRGHIDILVNNAGTISVGPMEVMNLGDYDEAMKTHFWGPLHLTLERGPGAAFERLLVRRVDIAEQAGHPSALVVVRENAEGVEVGLEQHVRLLDPHEALDR